MFGNIVTKTVIWLMRNTKFSTENRVLCTTALIDKLHAIPSGIHYLNLINTFYGGATIIQAPYLRNG